VAEKEFSMRVAQTVRIVSSFFLMTVLLLSSVGHAIAKDKTLRVLEGAVIGAGVGSLVCGKKHDNKKCAKKGAAIGAIAGL
jgi:hypothetical protein